MSADIFSLLTLSLHLSLSYSLPLSPTYSLTLSSFPSFSHFFHYIIPSSHQFIFLLNPTSSPSLTPLLPTSPHFYSYNFHFSIPHPSPSSYSLTQDLTNPPGRPSYMELPRPVEVWYYAWFQVSWAPPDYTANLTSVQYRVYYLRNGGVTDTPTITTEVLGVPPGRLTSEVAVISPNKEVISERGPRGRSERLNSNNYRCKDKGERQSIDLYFTFTHIL